MFDLALGMPAAPDAAVAGWVGANGALALRRASHDELGALGEAAAAWLHRELDVTAAADSIVVVPSGRTAIHALISVVLAPDDGVVVTEPGYPVFAELARHNGAAVHAVPLDASREFAPALESLSAATAQSVRLVGLNYPNNPTAACFSPRIAAALEKTFPAETVLFNDAVYGPLTLDGRPCSLMTQGALDPHTRPLIELHSLSKLFGLGPLGLGFFAGSEALLQDLRRLADFAWAPPSSLQVQVATRCMRDTQRLVDVRDDLRQRIARLRATLEELGFAPYPTPAGLYVLCPTPRSIAGRATPDATTAAGVLLDRFGLAVVPWDLPGASYLRFAALCRPEDLEALGRLADRLLLEPAR